MARFILGLIFLCCVHAHASRVETAHFVYCPNQRFWKLTDQVGCRAFEQIKEGIRTEQGVVNSVCIKNEQLDQILGLFGRSCVLGEFQLLAATNGTHARLINIDEYSQIQSAVWRQFRAKVEYIRLKIERTIRGHDPSGIVRKLLLDQDSNADSIGMFRMLGFVHLLSASGIHLYAMLEAQRFILFFLFTWIFGKGGRKHVPFCRTLGFISAVCLWGCLWMLEGFRSTLIMPLLVLLRHEINDGINPD